MSFQKGQSGHAAGRTPGSHSAVNEVKRSQEVALRNIAKGATDGDIAASIAVIQYNTQREIK